MASQGPISRLGRYHTANKSTAPGENTTVQEGPGQLQHRLYYKVARPATLSNVQIDPSIHRCTLRCIQRVFLCNTAYQCSLASISTRSSFNRVCLLGWRTPTTHHATPRRAVLRSRTPNYAPDGDEHVISLLLTVQLHWKHHRPRHCTSFLSRTSSLGDLPASP